MGNKKKIYIYEIYIFLYMRENIKLNGGKHVKEIMKYMRGIKKIQVKYEQKM